MSFSSVDFFYLIDDLILFLGIIWWWCGFFQLSYIERNIYAHSCFGRYVSFSTWMIFLHSANFFPIPPKFAIIFVYSSVNVSPTHLSSKIFCDFLSWFWTIWWLYAFMHLSFWKCTWQLLIDRVKLPGNNFYFLAWF